MLLLAFVSTIVSVGIYSCMGVALSSFCISLDAACPTAITSFVVALATSDAVIDCCGMCDAIAILCAFCLTPFVVLMPYWSKRFGTPKPGFSRLIPNTSVPPTFIAAIGFRRPRPTIYE